MKMRVKLSSDAIKVRQKFIDHWEIDDPAGLMALDELCACFDRLQRAKRQLAKDGATTIDRFKQQKVSAAFQVVRDEATLLIKLQGALGLDIGAQHDDDDVPVKDGFAPELSLMTPSKARQ